MYRTGFGHSTLPLVAEPGAACHMAQQQTMPGLDGSKQTGDPQVTLLLTFTFTFTFTVTSTFTVTFTFTFTFTITITITFYILHFTFTCLLVQELAC